MSVEKGLCPICIRREHPGISNAELRTLGATTANTCAEHHEAVATIDAALRDAYRNTRGGFA